ncbi:NO-inducible flavohemoprotein [Peribacillus sp. SCS-26]|uniref:NO-inducible flavohemoprotein n=1 Tax=Paraperibacillus marinus TaxID=3115295 RepID=UPI0039058DEB
MLKQETIDIIKATVPVLQVKGVEITTVFYNNLFKSHPELLNIFNHVNQKRGRQQTALANTVLAAAMYIDKLETIIPAVKKISHKHRSLMVQPEHYPIVGEHLLGAIKEVLGDAATEDILNAWGEAYGVIADAFIGIEKEMYDEASAEEGGFAGFKQFQIIDQVKESDVITSFYLKPADSSILPSFIPGQYITVRVKIPGEEYLHNRQYSLSAAPGREYLRISVKREQETSLPGGKVSNYLHDIAKTGDLIEITAPAGDFVLTEGSVPITFIGGGVGITPFMSMLQYIGDTQPQRKVHFINASQNGRVQPFRDELENISGVLKNMELSYIYSRPVDQDVHNVHFKKAGYIDRVLLGEAVRKNEGGAFYVCGPVPFLEAVITGLKQEGIAESSIHYEFFGPSVNLETE